MVQAMTVVSGHAVGASSNTSDPKTAHMRVFVGNLNTNNITKPTMQNIFGKYGSITGKSKYRRLHFFIIIDYNFYDKNSFDKKIVRPKKCVTKSFWEKQLQCYTKEL